MKIQQMDVQEITAPPDHLQQELLLHKDRLSVVPVVAMEAIEMTKDPDCSMSDFTCLVEKDVRLSTDILAVANSALFSNGKSVSNIHQSLVRLGLTRCRNLIMSACAKALMKNISLEHEWVREVLWSHSFKTASACLQMNHTFGLGFQGEEFTAGLLHDFGRMLLAIACDEKFYQADPLDFSESADILVRENAILGTNHCDFGAWYAMTQKLPESLIAVMRWHHQPERENEHQKLIALVAAGDHVANHLQRFGEDRGYDTADNVAVNVLSDLYQKNVADNFHEVAPQILANIQGMTTETKICMKERSNG